ncbi:MAG TPA: TetR/AcrR family transcriptional regulator [Bacteroidales bacterium]|nr:TetR/AcrR family transcriptional regulator [Bacteroidales bacterium]HPT10746.1 TetR/AcrR family transcriptional regulator [Bacteroidales bacterium]
MTEQDNQTEDRIFEAATEVFIEKGLDGSRMQDIADRAGINKSLLHYYYRSKDKLFNTVFEMIAMKMLKKFAPVFEGNLTFEEKIRFFFKEHISFLQKNPRLPAFLLNEINRHPERIRKFLANVNIESFYDLLYSQHKDELDRYGITRDNFPQIMTTLASLSVFPFAAKKLLEELFGKVRLNFDDYIEERKTFAADFSIAALKNMNRSTTDNTLKKQKHGKNM